MKHGLMELKTTQIQGKYLTITMYTRMHAPTQTHTLFFWLTNNLKHLNKLQ